MARWRWLLGVVSVSGLAAVAFSAGCSDKGSSGTPLTQGGSTAAGGSPAMGGSSTSGGAGGMSSASCTATAAATKIVSPYAITVDATGNVFWSNSSDTDPCANVIMMQAPGGTPTEVAKVDQSDASTGSTNIAKGLALDGQGNLYYGAGYALYRVKAQAGQTPTKVGSNLDGKPVAIVPTATRIFTALDIDNAIQWRNPDPATNGCTDPITRPKPLEGETADQKTVRINTGACAFAESIGGMVADALWPSGKLLVVINYDSLEVADTTVPATQESGHAKIMTTESFAEITGMTVVGNTAYFGERTGGAIDSLPVPAEKPADMSDKPGPTVLVTDATLVNPTSFVNDGKNVFFRTGAMAADSCRIMMLTTSGASPAAGGGGAGGASGTGGAGGTAAGAGGAAGGGSGSAKVTELAHVDACGKMNLAVGKNVIWYTDRAHDLVKSVAIPQ